MVHTGEFMADDNHTAATEIAACGARYIKAPAGWSPTDPNPFTDEGSYGQAWSAFVIEDRADGQFITGRSGQGPFCARFGKGVSCLENRLADFLRYECAHGRTVILSAPADIDVDRFVASALDVTPPPDVVRSHDSHIIVHSTTQRAWASIRVAGALLAASQLEGGSSAAGPELDPPSEVLRYYQDEPAEYADYIMFAEIGQIGPERVVASRAAGRFVMDPDAIYTPGVRLYFDNHRLIKEGRGTRDGLHTLKVHQRLPLYPYLLRAVSVEDIDPEGERVSWTLRAFMEMTDALIEAESGCK
jgi:hypothetical protein